MGSSIGIITGDTRSLDCNSLNPKHHAGLLSIVRVKITKEL